MISIQAMVILVVVAFGMGFVIGYETGAKE